MAVSRVFLGGLIAALSLISPARLTSSNLGLDTKSPWPKFHADLRNSGQTTYAYPVTTWQTPTSANITLSSPAIGTDGTVFLGGSDGKVEAFDPKTGALKWSYSTSGPIQSSPVVSSTGALFIGSQDGYVYALKVANGAVIWKFKTGGAVNSTPALCADGTLYVGSADGNLYKLNQGTGAKVYSFHTAGPVYGSPTIKADGTVFVGCQANRLYAIDGSKGTFKWSFPTSGPIPGCPALANGMIYFGTTDGSAYGLNAVTGTEVWAIPTKAQSATSPCLGASGDPTFGLTLPATQKNAGQVAKYNGLTGKLIWSYNVPAAVKGTPAIDLDESLYVLTNGAQVFELNGSNGALENFGSLGTAASSSLAISTPGHVVVGAFDKTAFLHPIAQPVPINFQANVLSTQTGPSTVNPTSASLLIINGTTNIVRTGSAKGSMVTPAGLTKNLPVLTSTNWGKWLPVSSESDIRNALPLGSYSFTFPGLYSNFYSRGTLNGYTFPINQPSVLNYNEVQSMRASVGMTVRFPALQKPNVTCWGSPLVSILDAASGNQVFFGNVWGTNGTTQAIPANILTPGKQYNLLVGYVIRVTGEYLGWNPNSVVTYFEFDRETQISFTPAP